MGSCRNLNKGSLVCNRLDTSLDNTKCFAFTFCVVSLKESMDTNEGGKLNTEKTLKKQKGRSHNLDMHL